MKEKILVVLKWTAIVIGGLYFLLWAFYGEHESYPHAALALFIVAFWWQMNQKLNRINGKRQPKAVLTRQSLI
jgi:hypothetical protein